MIKRLWITFAVAGLVLFAAVKSHSEERQCPMMTYNEFATELDKVKETLQQVDAMLQDRGIGMSQAGVQKRWRFLDLMTYCMRKEEAERRAYIERLIQDAEKH